MTLYDFELLNDGAVIAASRSIALPDLAAAWPKIGQLARTVSEPGCKIRVKDEAGGIVILVGVASARRYADAGIAA
jgi:hypothetical protein